MVMQPSVVLVYALWATLSIPLLGSIVLFLFGGTRGRTQHNPASPKQAQWPGILGTVCITLALASSLIAVGTVGNASVMIGGSSEWIPGFGAACTLQLDRLSGPLLILVDAIALMVVLFSLEYMKHDHDQDRYYGALLFFIVLMKLIVLAGSYLLLFAGWEGVGLASYLLIGFHHERPRAASAATKAFVVNRVGDAGLILAVMAMAINCGSTNYAAVAAKAAYLPHGTVAFICVLLAIGAIGKSAQFPLHIWLPDAMEGPTPVSALIHSATMVCAGVYLLARSSFLLDLAPEVGFAVAILGSATALFAATVAIAENDIKRVLAYSTISQIGFMFVALGLRADRAAMFHLITHAFFKALLFLGAGSLIHALHGEQNLKHMGGLRKRLPTTFWTMLIAAATLAGVPGLAGFFSKDLILEAGIEHHRYLFTVVGLLTSLLTATYAGRAMALAFFGAPRQHQLTAQEGGWSMRIPLILLAVACVGGGWFIMPVEWTALPGTAWLIMLSSSLIALTGLAIAWYFYLGHPEKRFALDVRFAPMTRFLRNRWYIDALYEQRVLNGFLLRTAEGADYADRVFIDGSVNAVGRLSGRGSSLFSWFDRTVIDGAVRFAAGVMWFLSWPFRAVQTGFVQTYAFLFIAGVLAVLGFYLIH